MFLAKWHLYKKYEFFCGVSGSNNFLRLETPIKTPDPIFLPRVSRCFWRLEKKKKNILLRDHLTPNY